MTNKFLILFLISGVLVIPFFIFAGTIDPTNKYAWGENIGWINFGCDGCNVVVSDTDITGYAWSENYGWINLNPTNGGITNDNGDLSGFAWGENIGWINFENVSIDPGTGEFSGTATETMTGSEGLINFSCTAAGCPVTTDWRSSFIAFSLSDDSIGFGTVSTSAARYATGDLNGSAADLIDAHTISAASNAGYVILVNGTTLKKDEDDIDAIGGTPTSSIPGTEQFGMRVIKISGTGSASEPYNTENWALDTEAFPDEIATGPGDSVTTVFGIRYICNISTFTIPGNYGAVLTFTISPRF